MKGLHTRCSQHQLPRRWDNACYPKRAIYNPECPEPHRADGHAAVADTSPVRLDALLDAELLINRKPVLVAPKPNNRPMNQLRQLRRRNLIPTLKGGVRPVMRQQNQSAFVA